MKAFLMVAGLGFLLAACAVGDESTPGVLAVKSSADSLKGSFAVNGAQLQFSSTETAPGIFDVVLDFHGLTLSALVDRNHQVAEADGFAHGGTETQLVESDRAVLRGLLAALSEQPDTESLAAAAMLTRLVSNWSQLPDTVPLQRQVASSESRSWTSLCAAKDTYVSATHNDNKYAKNDPRATSLGHVGLRSPATEYYVDGKWITTTQDHVAGLYERGSCFGNCGAGCPSGVQTLTVDCHNHDQCVRNGHALASLYCDDEFVAASDDEFFAPRCPGT